MGLSVMLVAVALAVAAYAAMRLVTAWPSGRRLHYDINISHVLMGTAMAGMVVPSLDVLSARAWEGVFGAEAMWFAWATARFVYAHGLSGKDDDQVHRAPHYATHTVMAFSMLYMYLQGGGLPTGQAGMAVAGHLGGAADTTWLSLLFVVFLLVSATCEIDSVHQFARLGALSTTAGASVAATQMAGASVAANQMARASVAANQMALGPPARQLARPRWLERARRVQRDRRLPRELRRRAWYLVSPMPAPHSSPVLGWPPAWRLLPTWPCAS